MGKSIHDLTTRGGWTGKKSKNITSFLEKGGETHAKKRGSQRDAILVGVARRGKLGESFLLPNSRRKKGLSLSEHPPVSL